MTNEKRPRRRTSEPETWAGSASGWKKRGGPHRLTLPSGMRVRARVLGLTSLASLDGLPTDLTNAVVLHIANLEAGGLPAVIGAEIARVGRGDDEARERAEKHVTDFAQITRHIVAASLVEPTLTVDELDEVPEEDLEMLMRIVTGRQTFDAAGVRIGVEPLEPWAPFRNEHKCPPDCAACTQARRQLSTLLLDDDEL